MQKQQEPRTMRQMRPPCGHETRTVFAVAKSCIFHLKHSPVQPNRLPNLEFEDDKLKVVMLPPQHPWISKKEEFVFTPHLNQRRAKHPKSEHIE